MECLETKNETETICVYVEAPLIACFPNAQYTRIDFIELSPRIFGIFAFDIVFIICTSAMSAFSSSAVAHILQRIVHEI